MFSPVEEEIVFCKSQIETSRREKRKLRFSFIRSPERDGEVFGEQFPKEFLPGICEFALK